MVGGIREAMEADHWQLNYGRYDRAAMLAKLHDLSQAADVTGEDIERSAEFVELTFDRWEGRSQETLEGDFCFVVPPRISRSSATYASEVEPFLPIVRHFPVDVRQRTFVGLPPYLVDRYGEGSGGGLMVYTPVFIDMVDDIADPQLALDVARGCVRDSVAFAQRFTGVRVAGLAATLPNLTDMGRAVTCDGVVTTTGHAGTVWLIAELVRQHAADFAAPNAAVIGLGSIGQAFAWLALEHDLVDQLHLFDTRGHVADNVAASLRERFGDTRVHLHDSVGGVLAKSQIVVAAVTTPIDLDAVPAELVEGRVFIDDSQPAAFDAAQVTAKGATLRWVMGQDRTEGHQLSRRGIDGRAPYNYGDDCGLTDERTLWGCEAEAAAIALTGRLDLALDRRVEPGDAAAIGDLWAQVGIEAARR